MISSKAVGLLKNLSRSCLNKKLTTNLQQVRHSHGDWQYRTFAEPPKWAQRASTACAVICWWWFYWNLYHGWPHLVGLYDGKPLPNPRDWTDEELGIPPVSHC